MPEVVVPDYAQPEIMDIASEMLEADSDLGEQEAIRLAAEWYFDELRVSGS